MYIPNPCTQWGNYIIEMSGSDLIKLTLENFEDYGLSQTTPYILTSPRSLKACEKFGIEPSELVYRSLEEYEETLADLPLSEIYRIYEENETERQEKLLKCRELRKMNITESSHRKKKLQKNLNNFANMIVSSSDSEQNHQRLSRGPNSAQNHQRLSRGSNSAQNHQRLSRGPNSAQNHQRLSRGPNSAQNHHRLSRGGSNSAQQLSRTSTTTTKEKRIRESRRRKVQYCSETESLADENEGHTRSYNEKSSEKNRISYSSKSVPDLRRSKNNLDFHKISPLSWSPRICTFGSLNNDNQILQDYMARYGDIISSTELTQLTRDDRKILELLLLKKGREMERHKLSQDVQEAIENERLKRIQETKSWNQKWYDRLNEKRKIENIENTNRYLYLENQWRNNRLGLLHYLEGRDAKVEKYLENLQYQRRKAMLEKQQGDAIRQLEVGRAIDKLLDEDRQHREALSQRLQVRMREAEIRKRRKEQDYWRHIQDMNRLEDIKRDLRHEQIELAEQRAIVELRSQLDEKEQRATINYMNQLNTRNILLTQGAGNRNKSIEKARTLHTELMTGLNEWHKKIYELQKEAQERAAINYTHEITRRRTRVASERVLREERTLEMLRRVKEKEEKQREIILDVIEIKNSKSAKVKAEKERRIYMSRLRAQLGAELRQKLREKLDPETFDKKAARADIELKLFKKSSTTIGRFNTNKKNILSKHYYQQRQPYCICNCKK